MIKRIIGLVIFLLIANAAARVAIVVFHDQQFNDAVREIALFGAGKPDEALRIAVMKAAADNQVPLDAEYIEITRRTVVAPNDKVTIKVVYAVLVKLGPGYSRRFDFEYMTP
jgi:hypothetical protein